MLTDQEPWSTKVDQGSSLGAAARRRFFTRYAGTADTSGVESGNGDALPGGVGR